VRDLALVDNDPLTSLVSAQAMSGLTGRTDFVRCLDFPLKIRIKTSRGPIHRAGTGRTALGISVAILSKSTVINEASS
jgi:hypothetical protein